MSEIDKAHDGILILGYLRLPFQIRQDGDNSIIILIGDRSSPFAKISIQLNRNNGELTLRYHLKPFTSDVFEIYLGNVLGSFNE